MLKTLGGGILATAFVLLSTTAFAEPEIVSGPAADAGCFAPWTAETKFFKFPKKEGPYRIALANGYIANTWRIQMIQTAKAYAAQPDVAAQPRHCGVVMRTSHGPHPRADLPPDRAYRRGSWFPVGISGYMRRRRRVGTVR